MMSDVGVSDFEISNKKVIFNNKGKKIRKTKTNYPKYSETIILNSSGSG